MDNNNLPTNNDLLKDLMSIIDRGKRELSVRVNSQLILVYWQIGKRINEDILQDKRAEYGKQVIPSISAQLTERYGKSFQLRNLRRMMQFAEVFQELEIVSTASTQLSWSHFVELLPLANQDARIFYIQKIKEGQWSVRHTRQQIERKVFERSAIADSQLPAVDESMKSVFKDPYFLDFLGLKEGYLEEDLEAAILKELELFILELGMGFTFVDRQKRMIIDGKDFHLDLLFYHRKLRRLVAIDLKLGRFKAEYKGQMELYLRWLEKYDIQEGEQTPIGLILCAEAGQEQVELLQTHKDGIMVPEYWTDLPSKEVLERKLHEALVEARERIARRRLDS